MRSQYFTPVVTAFKENGEIDYKANENIIEHLINNGKGVDGILFLGSTGDFFAIPYEDRKKFVKFAIEKVNNRVKVLVGTGGMDLRECIDFSNYVTDLGGDGVLVINHYYFRQSEESLAYYYSTVAENCKGNIYIYNYPNLTGICISPELILKLVSKYKNIVGIKNSNGNTAHTREIIATVKASHPDFQVFTGFDEHFIWNIMSGGQGTMGALSNLVPDMCYEWKKALERNDIEKISEIQVKINKMNRLYDIDSPPNAMLKKAMILIGVEMDDFVPEPFLRMNEDQTERIKEILKSCDVI
jgi:Dihydrodipicolinate synthase/N-acetylneuraminate lyase